MQAFRFRFQFLPKWVVQVPVLCFIEKQSKMGTTIRNKNMIKNPNIAMHRKIGLVTVYAETHKLRQKPPDTLTPPNTVGFGFR